MVLLTEIAVEPGHSTEVLRVPVTLEQALDALFDAIGDLFQSFLILFGHSVLLSQIIELKKARPRTGRDKPMRERAHYLFSERMLLPGGRIFAVLARKLSASRRRSLYGSRTEIQRLGTK